jgi:hypothetical protein
MDLKFFMKYFYFFISVVMVMVNLTIKKIKIKIYFISHVIIIHYCRIIVFGLKCNNNLFVLINHGVCLLRLYCLISLRKVGRILWLWKVYVQLLLLLCCYLLLVIKLIVGLNVHCLNQVLKLLNQILRFLVFSLKL